jgi:type II secretory pathway predicted ATPase ExeA
MYIDFSSFFNQSLGDTAGYYPAKNHEKAFLKISDGINYHHNVFFLRGIKGVGKTHILKRLYQKPEPGLRKTWLSASHPDVDVIMQTLADQYGVRWDIANANTLRRHLVKDIKNKRMPVLYIDDVDRLDAETVIKLSNILRWRKQSLAKIVFAGPYKMTAVLKMFVKHNNVKAMHSKLQPLDAAEIPAYIVQLSRASGYAGRSPFGKQAMRTLIKYSKGVPARINQLCDCCLFIARTQNRPVLDAALVKEAARGLHKLHVWVPSTKSTLTAKRSSSTRQLLGKTSIGVASATTPKTKQSKHSTRYQENRLDSPASKDDDLSQVVNSKTMIGKESRLAADEWEQALNSYRLKHPKRKVKHSANVAKKPASKFWKFASMLLLVLLSAFGAYYFLNQINHSSLGLPVISNKSGLAKHSDSAGRLNENAVSKINSGVVRKRESEESALILAVWNNQILEINELLQLGADVNTRNHFGQTPLMIASMFGSSDVIKTLLENDAALNVIDNQGLTAVMLGARNGQSQVVEFLLNNGADVNVQDKRGLTALMHAASFGHKTTVQVILKFNPELDIKSNKGRSADVIASSQGYQHVAKIIQIAQ